MIISNSSRPLLTICGNINLVVISKLFRDTFRARHQTRESAAEQFLPRSGPGFLNVPGPQTILWESRGRVMEPVTEIRRQPPSVWLPSARPFKLPTVFDVSISLEQPLKCDLNPGLGMCQISRRKESRNDIDSEATHPSLTGRVAKVLTRELVYYILLGTLRGSQKYHWPVLRFPFGEKTRRMPSPRSTKVSG